MLSVVADECRHFKALNKRLEEIGGHYGMIDAHKGLWLNCQQPTLMERLAIIPLVQEARGLDAGPKIVKKLVSVGDVPSSKIVDMIVREEVGHVKTGMKWFSYLCR